MSVNFRKLIDYLKYLLRYLRSALVDSELIALSPLKLRVNGLYSTLDSFNGTVPIRLLKFLSTLGEPVTALLTEGLFSVRVGRCGGLEMVQ